MRPLRIVLRGRFLFITTYEMKTGLFIERDSLEDKTMATRVRSLVFHTLEGVCKGFVYLPIPCPRNNVKGFLGTLHKVFDLIKVSIKL